MNWILLKNSFLVSALATLLAMAAGIVFALFACGLPKQFRHVSLGLPIAALAMPPFLITNCWLHYLGHAGVWRAWLPFEIYSFGGTVWILALLTWPITFFLVWGAWQNLDPAQLEADPAVTGWALFKNLLLPLVKPALSQAAALTFILSLNNFAVPGILQVKVAPAEMWVLYNTSFDTEGAVKMSWPLVLVPLMFLLWLSRNGLLWKKTAATLSPSLFREQLGSIWFVIAALGSVFLAILSVGLPCFQLLSVKRTWTELPGAIAAGQVAIGHSFFFAALAALAIVVIGLLARSVNGFGSRRTRLNFFFHRVGFLLWLPFLIPGVALGIGLIGLFNHPWSFIFYRSMGIVLVAFTIRYFAPGYLTVAHALAGVDSDLTDAARIEGAGSWQLFRRVLWPQIAPQVAAGWYIIFLLCLWDVESLVLIVPPGGETLALRIFNFLHYGHNAQVNALCLTLLALAMIPLLFWQLVRLVLASRRAFSGISVLGLILLMSSATGCKPARSEGEYPIQSEIFSSVKLIGSRGVGVGQFNKPRSLAVDAHDNLYVVDMTGRVQKFSPDGQFILQWQMPQTELGKPKGMGRDLDGNILVVEPHYQRINLFSTEGKLLRQWGHKGNSPGQFTLPRGVAINSRNEIFVSEYTTMERVQCFKFAEPEPTIAPDHSMPTLLNVIGSAGNAPGEFNRPEGLCIDAADLLYVADSCNHRIQVFSREGKLIRTYGKAGAGPGELSYPYDICVDKEGRQYVCEFGNSRIQIFDQAGKSIEIIGKAGGDPGQFSNPWGLALDSQGNLYVADSQNHRVQKLIRQRPISGASTSIVPPSATIPSSARSAIFVENAIAESRKLRRSGIYFLASEFPFDRDYHLRLCRSYGAVPTRGGGETDVSLLTELAPTMTPALSVTVWEKAAADSRTPRRSREAFARDTAARSWRAAVLCRFDRNRIQSPPSFNDPGLANLLFRVFSFLPPPP
jgi:ABC-type Fe3+ transport system permease subunit/DNA-binding beta-propeller fold protein YncE